MMNPLHFMLLAFSGWINRDQQKIIEYLLEEIRIYQEHFDGRRLRFTDQQRRHLAIKAKALDAKPPECRGGGPFVHGIYRIFTPVND